jgi:hypothetical protein
MNPGQPDDDLLPTILGICEDFFASAGPAIHRELDTLLRAHDISGGTGWLIDILTFTRRRLQTAPDPTSPQQRRTCNQASSQASNCPCR